MPFIFGNPILGRLEDLLWEKANKRYVDEGNNPIKDLQSLAGPVKDKFEEWVDSWKKSEKVKLDIGWKVFRQIALDKTQEALTKVFERSMIDWYAVEVGSLPTFPEIVAVPYLVLWRATELEVPALLKERIEFKDMLPETLDALSSFAVDRYFDKVLENVRDEHTSFKLDNRGRWVIVDLIKNDFYHLGDQPNSRRVDMVILSTFSQGSGKDAAKRAGEKTAEKEWAKRCKQTDGRRNDRRFSGKGWNLPPSFLDDIVSKAD
jgi:hypothetical protein